MGRSEKSKDRRREYNRWYLKNVGRSEASRIQRQEHEKQRKLAIKLEYAPYREHMKLERKAFKRPFAEQQRIYHLRQNYKNIEGFDPNQYFEMHAAQEGRCPILEKKFPPFGKSDALVVDHNHATGKFRALISPAANKALGLLEESINIILNLLAYKLKEIAPDRYGPVAALSQPLMIVAPELRDIFKKGACK